MTSLMTLGVDDMIFLARPDKWPNYPLCPVKNMKHRGSNGAPQFGIVTTMSLKTVYLVSICEAHDVDLSKCPKKAYASIKELVNDGWVVD